MIINFFLASTIFLFFLIPLLGMPIQFNIAYALYRGRCLLADIFRESVISTKSSFNGDELVGRFIGVRIGADRTVEGCLRISFKRKEFLNSLMKILQKYKMANEFFYRSRGNVLLYLSHNACANCPVVYGTSGVVPKSILVTPFGLLFELVYRKREIPNDLFEVLISGRADDVMGYMLTPREQEVLYYAYFRGYYGQPHGISLDQLSEELNISKSTLSEILRNAERKIVTAYMRHDLPHLVLSKILSHCLDLRPLRFLNFYCLQ
jgi:DNA-binding CsgD family transcriptional regulator